MDLNTKKIKNKHYIALALLTELRIMISCHDRGGRETLLTTAETILCSLEASVLAVWTLPCPHPASTRPSLSPSIS